MRRVVVIHNGSMTQPWGISGPEFVALYFVGIFVSMFLVMVAHALLPRVGFSGNDAPIPALDLYQAAYLADGPGRVVDTAIVGLVVREQVILARGRRLTAVSGAAVTDPIEGAVYESLRPTESRAAVHRRLRDHPTVTLIGDHLRAQGLMLDETRCLLWRLVLLVPVAVWLIGLVRAINGVSLHRPTSNLGFLLVITGLFVFLVLRRWSAARHQPSPLGRQALRRFREQRPWKAGAAGARRNPAWDPQVAGVAVLGAGGLIDPDLRKALFGNGGGSSGAHGCGGGGCGGGGGGGGCGG